MTTFRWRKELETGLPLIDGQHKRLIETANTFMAQCQAGAASSDVASCLAFLDEYVSYHFDCEEKIQKQCGYPACESHAEQHQVLKKQLQLHKVRLDGSNLSNEEVAAFSDTVKFWIKEHVMGDDVAFVQYYKSLGAK